MRDAVQITRGLGIRYIWIDALCIVQDDPKDWDREAMQMKDIYRNACLVISGTRTGNCHQSLFGERKASAANYGEYVPSSFTAEQVPLKSSKPTPSSQPAVYVREALPHDLLNEEVKQDLDQHPLLGRGWIFQERLLATRTAHFTSSEIMWECNAGFMCECGSSEPFKKLSLLQRARQGASDETSALWRRIVHAYSARMFTYHQDRLAALDGVASLFKDFGLGSYSFGLWGANIIAYMLWWVHRGQDLEILPEAYQSVAIGPSWSWLSTHRNVNFNFICHPIATVVGQIPIAELTMGVKHAISSPPTSLNSWKLTLRAKARRGVFEHEPCKLGKEACYYRVRLMETSEPQTKWPALDFYPDIHLCPAQKTTGSERCKSKWLDERQVVECILLADGVFRSKGVQMMSRNPTGLDAGLVVKESTENPGVYFRVGFFNSSWLDTFDRSRPPVTRSNTVWDDLEESEISLV